MLKISAAVVLVLGSSLAAVAAASDLAVPAVNEPGTVYTNPEYIVVEGRLARIAPDRNWTFVDGDTGWQLRQPSYVLRGGRLVATDSMRRDTPQPKLADDIWANPDERYRSGG